MSYFPHPIAADYLLYFILVRKKTLERSTVFKIKFQISASFYYSLWLIHNVCNGEVELMAEYNLIYTHSFVFRNNYTNLCILNLGVKQLINNNK